jgi:hypothetical protein
MNHFTDRQLEAVISAGDEQTCRMVMRGVGFLFLSVVWVESCRHMCLSGVTKYENILENKPRAQNLRK